MDTQSYTNIRKRTTLLSGVVLLVAAALALSGCGDYSQSGSEGIDTDARSAIAHLSPTKGNQATGTVTFIEEGENVRVIVSLTNVPEGKHGFHVHENGDCSAPDASSAGGHFNPAGAKHGAPDDEARHVGDLGNVTATSARTVDVEFVDDKIALEEDRSVVGRAVVLHAGADDLASQPSGDAGSRIACGVIELR